MKHVLIALSLISVAAHAQDARTVVCAIPANPVTSAPVTSTIVITGDKATASLAVTGQAAPADSSPMKCTVQAVTAADIQAEIEGLKKEAVDVLKEVPSNQQKAVKEQIDAAIKKEEDNGKKLAGTTLVKCYGDQDYYSFFLGSNGKASQFGYDGGNVSESIISEISCK